MSKASPARRLATATRPTCGRRRGTRCPWVYRGRGKAAWIKRVRGDVPIGAERCSVFKRTLRCASKPATGVGLQRALRAILDETGGYAFDRDIDDVLAIGDAATGTHVLRDLYRAGKETAQTPDLDLLWSRLGVPTDPKTEPFEDHAPLASIRIAITASKPIRSVHDGL